MMSPAQRQHTLSILKEVESERMAQHIRWGEQNHPNFTEAELTDEEKELAAMLAATARSECQKQFDAGRGSYSLILEEEYFEASAERHDPALLRAELVQLAAVAVAWIEKIDRDKEKEKTSE